MPELNETQFAKYSAVNVPHPFLEYETKPLPASMERHAPGEYQPTLPGMEHMLKGEQTHADVFFKHPNIVDPETAEVKGSDWYNRTHTYYPKQVRSPISSLHPSQDWMDDSYINKPAKPPVMGYHEEGRPLVEKINGKNVVHDGHHRVVREILAGQKSVQVARWGGKDN